MSERQPDATTRSLIDQIDECLRDAERLRNHVSTPQPQFWPERRRESRIPADPGKRVKDETGGAR